ncbi:hypothetical protein AJ87_23380 [Rhizobium yanglingense]|nr:hypothetical protein AJ87_23380 [Rhizobium yanglingense]
MVLRQVQTLDVQRLEGIAVQMDRVGVVRGVDQIEDLGLAVLRSGDGRLQACLVFGFRPGDIVDPPEKTQRMKPRYTAGLSRLARHIQETQAKPPGNVVRQSPGEEVARQGTVRSRQQAHGSVKSHPMVAAF